MESYVLDWKLLLFSLVSCCHTYLNDALNLLLFSKPNGRQHLTGFVMLWELFSAASRMEVSLNFINTKCPHLEAFCEMNNLQGKNLVTDQWRGVLSKHN